MCCGITFINSGLRHTRKECEGRYFYIENFQLNLPLEGFLSFEENQDNLVKGIRCTHLTNRVCKSISEVF